MPRFYCPVPLATGTPLDLPPDAARHVQVLRLQPGHAITLFNGTGGEWDACVTRMGRSDVQVAVGAHHAVEREAVRTVHLLAAISANERMDWLVEKAAELGAASITPLLAERSVLKLKGERAGKKLAHWRAVASAACEQCGRNRVPQIHDAQSLAEWLASEAGRAAPPDAPVRGTRLLLSLRPDAQRLAEAANGGAGPVTLLSGPEGGLTSTEEASALAAGFLPVTLGPRVLRAETAPLAVLAALTL
ncbi:16S rRNA (uracil(1498)-N(3))-methyltransferase [Rhodoferax sediminis]|uniref:Ribosomal RNA small subunit methyltransferase E n=1 Tax=Rhodoferax sediminis TaxID=2509614 RepID=A0A515D636_9BURK|nr:16S rRNA (uracil(1498)-N(3))-methyltransferase [Rhodoferax sediminis]QDL35875.1 16S rRNA (uracil(1498)-N(3))-methyltransferase [Rhodoferax sediminis]